MTNGILIAITGALTVISGYLLKIYNLIFISIRLDSTLGYRMYKTLQNPDYRKIVISEDMCFDDEHDNPKNAKYIVLNKIPFIFECHERILQAGWVGTETISSITTFRPFRKRLKEFVKQTTDWGKEPICTYIYMNWYRKIKEIKHTNVFLNEKIKSILELIIDEISSEKREKTGILMYGPPGNGKSSIIKYIATNLNRDIYIPLIQKETKDGDFINMISAIPRDKKAIIVFEDFDNHFDKRTSVYGDKSNLNFSTILNVLDGLYCNLENKIVIITANDISKVDDAIKNRPSRCDFVINVENPNKESRREILNSLGQNGHSDILSDLTDGQSAAVVCEVGKRRFTNDDLEPEVNRILESFVES